MRRIPSFNSELWVIVEIDLTSEGIATNSRTLYVPRAFVEIDLTSEGIATVPPLTLSTGFSEVEIDLTSEGIATRWRTIIIRVVQL